ncbi:MAG: hypothetical protein A2Y12_19645 [Planctomycetes bacterium GWF2_42_9]|nr:MAG: hypothetical protein A2Y12_19645 [Planctomycetes bacterium GWF2_42_9]
MSRRQTRISKGTVFTGLLLGSLLCLLLPQSLTKRVNLAFLGIYKVIPSLGTSIPLASVSPNGPVTITGEYKKLQNEYQQLQNHCANLWAELANEHDKAQKLSGIRTRFPSLAGAAIITADVITSQAATGPGQLVINRGSADNLKKDQFVIADNAVIGRIAEISSRTAIVNLITSKRITVPVEVAGTKVPRKMTGDGKSAAKISLLQKKYPVKQGTLVYTCKMPGYIDVPFVIGKVSKCRVDADNPLLWDIAVTPAVNIETVSTISVVIMNP